MKKLMLIAAAAGLLLAGCADLQSLVGSDVSNDAMQGANVAITTYADVYQPAVITYGRLPACPSAVLCKDPAVFAKLKAIDASVTAAIVAAQGAMKGSVMDSGQITAAIQAIASAEATIAASGAMVPKT